MSYRENEEKHIQKRIELMKSGEKIDWREYEKQERQESLREDTYEKDGALRWQSNDAVIGLDVFADAGVEPPPGQKTAYDKYISESLAAYRKSMENYVPSDEELFEMRAAFGPGTEVVNVITGKKTKL